ncbi:MAG: RsmD family RNA methyltransferase [Myxococcales bacterium]|nr:RsmD family RNA methyltransferase [Myxococcales bacterium]
MAEPNPSPNVVATRVSCVHADRCAGCPMIEYTYDEQIVRKRARVDDAVSAYPGLEGATVEPTAPASPISAYRTRAKLVTAIDVDPEGRSGLVVGLYASGGGHVVLDTPECRVVSPILGEVAAALRALSREPGSVLARPSEVVTPPRAAPLSSRAPQSSGPAASQPPREPAQPQALVRAVDLREARDPAGVVSVLVTLIAARDDVRTPETLEALREIARSLRARLPVIKGVALGLRDGDSPQVLGSEQLVLDGESTAADTIGGVVHLATFGAFVQAHREQAQRVHETLAEAAKVAPGTTVLDLYGGSGAIGLALAARGAHVHLVESFAPAARLALEAARLGKDAVAVAAFETTAGEVSEVLAQRLRAIAQGEPKFDLVVLNPPRRGVAPLVRQQIAQLAPRAIGYVSCDPDTLARDLDHFRRLGYGAKLLQPVDMIPLTEEVETVAVLTPMAAPLPRVAYEDDEAIIVEKSPHEPATPQGEYAGSLLGRVRLLPGCDQAVPVHRLDVGTSGLVIFAKRASYVTAWADALGNAQGRKIYLAAARGRTPSKGAITRDLRDEGRLLPARTRYRWLGGIGGHSVLRIVPEQGRTHQIRRHLAAIGHPVLGDERYGHAPTNRFFEEKHGLDRTFLHCIRLELNHPKTGVRLLVETPLPGDLRMTLMRCGGVSAVKFLEGKSALGGDRPSILPPPSSNASQSGNWPSADRTSGSWPAVAVTDRPSGSFPSSERLPTDPPDVDSSPMSIRVPIAGSGDDD